MADQSSITRSFMVPEQPEAQQQAVRGGLASEERGGLSKFVGDVGRGINAVMSSPAYAHVWSGLVSGIAGDPMAGPMALAQLRQGRLEEENNLYRNRQMQRMEAQAEREAAARTRLAGVVGDPNADPRNVQSALAEVDPVVAARLRMAPPPAPGRPVPVMGPNGPEYVDPANAVGRKPVPRSPLVVNSYGDGLNPYQQAQTRAGYIDDHREESKPYVETASRLRELEGILAGLEGEPTPFQSEAAATAFAKGLKPAEAVMRDDIARILGQGWENQVKGFLNLPQKASRAQIEEMRKALSTIVGVAEMRQRSIDQKYQGLGSDYQVEIPSYAPTATTAPSGQSISTRKSAEPATRDAAYFESLPTGSVIGQPDGSRWRKLDDGSFEEVE